jgi:hypothetical protein
MKTGDHKKAGIAMDKKTTFGIGKSLPLPAFLFRNVGIRKAVLKTDKPFIHDCPAAY